MRQRPTIETERLILRPFELSDAADIQRMAGAKEVAAPTLNIPHPYEDGLAERWIETHQPNFEQGIQLNLAITLRADGTLVGAVGLGIQRQHDRAELGYWVGVPYWRNGYCTEAARAVVRYGFEELKLNRIEAHHFASNPASGRVMQKIGMTREGFLRQAIKKWDRYEDMVCYSLLREEFQP
jgi:RimJ/RimL family protein N-acetyltransferase